MASFFQDQTLLDTFINPGPKPQKESSDIPAVNILDWTHDSNGGYDLISRKVTVFEVAHLPVPAIRIILSPLDLPSSNFANSALWLFDHYAIPSAFLAARVRGATHSFGVLQGVAGYDCAWFHYLCKNVTVTHDAHRAIISDPKPGALHMEHGDSTWIRSGYFMKWAVDSGVNPQLTLLCFGASHYLKERFERIPLSSIPHSIALDPFGFFAIITEELSIQMDNTVWDLMSVFRHVELNTIMTTKDRESLTGIHNVSKQILFLQESAEAVMSTINAMSRHHQNQNLREVLEKTPAPRRHAYDMTRGILAHTETQFQSIGLRLRNLEKRMESTISLSFHLVTQDGNRIMQEDSRSMATIALVTLIFLPMSTVSTVFGSQFFNFDPGLVRVSSSFWLFWFVSIPLTLLVLILWRISLMKAPLADYLRRFHVRNSIGRFLVLLFGWMKNAREQESGDSKDILSPRPE